MILFPTLPRQPEIVITDVWPDSGPEFGNTVVQLKSADFPFINSKYLECAFGHLRVPLNIENEKIATCVSPPIGGETGLQPPRNVELKILFAGTPLQNCTVDFFYYLTPSVSKVTPPFGTTEGGTVVQLEGAHFREAKAGDLICKFDNTPVPVMRFISENLILCKV
jgi:hypothetical protein